MVRKAQIRTRDTTASERHFGRTQLLIKLAKEVCPCCARGDSLYVPSMMPGDHAIEVYDYHHSESRTCFANGLFKWAKSSGILFTAYKEERPKQK
jgi:hypothetical protein